MSYHGFDEAWLLSRELQTSAPDPSPRPAKASKYRNRKTTIQGEMFDSAKEAKRWVELKCREAAGEIVALRRQVPFALIVGSSCIGHYVSDFDYFDKAANTRVIEDCKGFKTQMYRWKKKHFEAQYGLKILET